jgi:hypothetical protein
METLVPALGVLIPLSAIVLGLGLSFWQIYWNHQKRQLQYRERQLMIEKGMTPPPMLLEEGRKSISPEASLRRGIILLFLGIGFGIGAVILASVSGNAEFVGFVGVAGAIVGSLGFGNLAYYAIARHTSEPPASASEHAEHQNFRT